MAKKNTDIGTKTKQKQNQIKSINHQFNGCQHNESADSKDDGSIFLTEITKKSTLKKVTRIIFEDVNELLIKIKLKYHKSVNKRYKEII